MNPESKLTVEIFRDVQSPDISVERAVAGIDKVREVTDLVELTRADRTCRLMLPGLRYVLPLPLVQLVPPTDADMAVVLTDKTFQSEKTIRERGKMTAGRTTYNLRRAPFAQAVVCTKPHIEVADVVAHETAHMIGPDHCGRQECVMSPTRTGEKSDFCPDCAEDLAISAFNLLGHRGSFVARLERAYW